MEFSREPSFRELFERHFSKLNSDYQMNIWDALKRVPAAVALLADIGALYSQMTLVPDSEGRPKDEFSRWLFVYLAVRFNESFGFEPRTGPDRAMETTDSLCWIKAVMAIAKSRLPLLKTRNGSGVSTTPHYQAVAAVAELAPATLADRLRNGWNEYSRLLADNAPGAAEGFQLPYL